jgi:hypothetical protein
MADPGFRYSDIYSMVSPNAQGYMDQAMGQTQGGQLSVNSDAVQAILDALNEGQQYDFLSNFEIGSPGGMQEFMGTMASVSGQLDPEKRELLRQQAQQSMLGQLTNEEVGNRPLQQHAMGQMLRKSLQVGGGPLPNPDMANQIVPQQAQPTPQPTGPGGALAEVYRKQMEEKETALEAGLITMAQAIEAGYDPNWRQKIGM